MIVRSLLLSLLLSPTPSPWFVFVQGFSASSSLRTRKNRVNLDEGTPRDLETLQEWAVNVCGIQTASDDCFQLQFTPDAPTVSPTDVSVVTKVDVPAETSVLFVPQSAILSSTAARDEMGELPTAVQKVLEASSCLDHVPQFYLLLKILKEYQLGTESDWYPWLNALPRYHANGASMTTKCFECLPPYVASLAKQEGMRCFAFFQAIAAMDQSWLLSDDITNDKELIRWAYAVVYTRGVQFTADDNNQNGNGNNEYQIVPTVDYLNHATFPTAELRYDKEGNAYVVTVADLAAGTPLCLQYGDPTNPSALLARYGFLDTSSPATFCKIIIENPSNKLLDMGYDPSRLLFFTESGEISAQVWDVVLYQTLLQHGESDAAAALHAAHTIDKDEETKQAIHAHYRTATIAALMSHVEQFLHALEQLQQTAADLNVQEHPRIPLIMSHNAFCRDIFLKVQTNLYRYSQQGEEA